jgi:tetratricopeptide (TPR) repeat protein
MNTEPTHQAEACLIGDYAGKNEEKEQWKKIGFRPSFVKIKDRDLTSLSNDQRLSASREFVHDGASFFQRGYIHYGLQLWREAIRIDPEIDIASCGYDNEPALSIFRIFKAEYNVPHNPQPIQHAASEILYQWLSNMPSACLYLASSKFAQNARCAYCGAPNILRAWPPMGDAVPFHYCKLEESHHPPGGYLIDVRCHKCGRVWCVVWDDDPIWASPIASKEPGRKDALHCWNAANAHRAAGRHEEALADYSRAIELDPTMIDAYVNRGNTYRDLKRDADAMNDYTRGLEIDPNDSSVYVNIGLLLVNRGDLDGAIAEFRAAIRLQPDLAEAHNNLGCALEAKDDLDGAIAEYRTAIRLRPDLAELHNNLGAALMAKGDPDGAVAACDAAILLQPHHAKAHYNLGNALAAKDDLNRAIAEFRTAIRLQPDDAKAHYNLGIMLTKAGDLDGTIAAYRAVIRLQPDDAKAHFNLGAAFWKKGDDQAAFEEFHKAYMLNPNEPKIRETYEGLHGELRR